MNNLVEQYRKEITERVIKALEKGATEWKKCWYGREAPQNAVTKHHYSGTNLMMLALKAMEFSTDEKLDPRWCTFKQAKDNLWRIKKGAHGTHILLWKPTVAENESGDREIVAVVQRVFTVFHASQIDGIPEYQPQERTQIETCEKADEIINGSGAEIHYGGGRAFYSPLTDCIHLPPREDFVSTESFYSTAFHELIHWTGGAKRLKRKQNGGKWTGDYAFEELIAEIGSMFVTSETGIAQTEGEFQNHASYISSWLGNLKKDNNYIFKAATAASKAANYLLKKELASENV